MGWNTALDGSGTTYYWNEKGVSQYEKPADFDPDTAQSAGAYSQYTQYGDGGASYNANGHYDYSHLSMQYSQPINTNYTDVQDQGIDAADSVTTEEYWKQNDVKVYGGAPAPFQKFEEANLPPTIMGAIAKAGFKTPSVIQAVTWPAAMAKRDVIGVAKTGSGKTLGFLVPGFLNVLSRQVNPQMGPSILCLAPTRELAMQIDVRLPHPPPFRPTACPARDTPSRDTPSRAAPARRACAAPEAR